MKRKLSLLMALMMVVALIPMSSFAASKSSVSTQTVASDSELRLRLAVQDDDAFGLTTGGVFEIILGEDAEWADVPDFDVDGGNETQRGSRVLEVTVTDSEEVRIEADVQLNNASGEQKVEVRNISANVTNQTLTYAVVSGTSDVIVRTLNDPKVITRAGENEIVPFEIREASAAVFEAGDEIEIQLPKDFSWDITDIVASNSAVEFKDDSDGDDMEDTLVVTLGAGAETAGIDRVIISDAIVKPARDARTGMVEVRITSNDGKFTRQYLDIAEYKDYNVNLKVDSVEEIIGGHEEDGREYEVLVTLEGNGDNSFLANRDIKVTTSNGKVALMSSVMDASVEKKDGTTLGLDSYQSEFYLLPDANADEIEMKLYVRGNWDAGDKNLELTVEGPGVEKQTVTIAEIKSAVTVETKLDNKTVADVILGLQEQAAPSIIISETEEGALLEGSYVIDFPGQRFAGVEIMDLDFDVEGDIDVDVEVSDNGNSIEITVDRTSREASTITIKDITVTLDRTVPYGPLNARLGVAGEEDAIVGGYFDDEDVTTIKSDIKFLNVVTEVQDARRLTTVFSLDSVTYTVDGEVRTLDAAPYISNNRTMLPIGTVAQLAGATVNYSPSSRTAVFTKDNLVVSMNLDTNILLVNGSPVAMDAKPEIVNSRAFVPVVYVAQAFGIQNGTDIVYDAATRTVTMFPNAQ